MPFITQEEREVVDNIPISNRTPGQRCYLHYRWMKKKWDKSPRWTTADEIYREAMYDRSLVSAEQRAKELAWQVFFELHVMPYERKKRDENGEVS